MLNKVFRFCFKTTTIFVICIILLVFILVISWMSFLHPQGYKMALKNAQILGKDVYSVNMPFYILVDKDFTSNDGFSIFRQDIPFIFTGKNVKDESPEPRKEVNVGLGENIGMSCVYSLENGDIKQHEFTLHLKNISLVDYNMDGRYDFRAPLDIKSLADVFYNGKWQNVKTGVGDKYNKELTSP
jgi:hypothetical protein